MFMKLVGAVGLGTRNNWLDFETDTFPGSGIFFQFFKILRQAF